VWDMWRVLPAQSHVTRLSRERTVRTAVQRLGRRWPILLPGRVWVHVSSPVRARAQKSNFSPINRPARAHTNSAFEGYSPSRIGESHPGHIAWVVTRYRGATPNAPRIPVRNPSDRR
jgi:hypothetical protein